MPEVRITESRISIVTLVVQCGLAASNSEARRKIGEHAVRREFGESAPEFIFSDPTEQINIQDGMVLRLGRRMVRIRH